MIKKMNDEKNSKENIDVQLKTVKKLIKNNSLTVISFDPIAETYNVDQAIIKWMHSGSKKYYFRDKIENKNIIYI